MPRSRKRDGPKFVQVYQYILDCAAWQDLSLGARALYVEMLRLFNGKNNGRIMFSHRFAAERLNCVRNTAAKHITELEDHGFIAKTVLPHLGVDGRGQATQWRFTHKPTADGQAPTFEFKSWSKSRPPAQNLRKGGSKSGRAGGEN